MKSIIYWHPAIYRAALKLLYGRQYRDRYRVIAEEVGGDDILDLCCGDCALAGYVKSYKGIDFDEGFVRSARKKGIDVRHLDIAAQKIPQAQCIVLQGSLYQFIPHHEKLIKKMLGSAKKVIISESGINVAQSKNALIAKIAKLLTSTSKTHKERFTKSQLMSLFEKWHAKKIIDTGRDLIGVFEP